MTVIGNPRSFHKKFKFIVEIDDVAHAGFQKCSVLSVEVANVQYFEVGSLIPNKSPGRLTFADVTLERGATQDRNLFDWFRGDHLERPRPHRRQLQAQPRHRAAGPRRNDAATLVALPRMARKVRRRRLGQRERRERHRVGDADLRFLRADPVGRVAYGHRR